MKIFNRITIIILICIILIVSVVFLLIKINNNKEVCYSNHERIKMALKEVNNKKLSESDSFYIMDYAKKNIIILHNDYYLIVIKKNHGMWSVDSLLDLGLLQCNYLQGSIYTSVDVSSNGKYVMIKNKDIENSTAFPLYIFNVNSKKINNYADGNLPRDFQIQYYDLNTKNISPDKKKFFITNNNEIEHLNIYLIKGDLYKKIKVKRSYSDDFYFLDNNTIINLFVDNESNNIPDNKIGDYRIVFYCINDGTSQVFKIE